MARTQKTEDQNPAVTDVDLEKVEAAAENAELTTDSATTAEDVSALAYRGKSIPAGWSFNPRRGFFKTDEE